MSELRIYADDAPEQPVSVVEDHDAIGQLLAEAGIRFERWQPRTAISPDLDEDDIRAAYAEDIARVQSAGGYQTVDVIRMVPDHPQREALREKFLSEHRHGEDEVRFFVDGCGLFYLHLGRQVFRLRCEAGDLVSVPAGTPHWFDMGAAPRFTAIRFFNNPEGWVAQYSGDPIAERFPRL